MNTNNPCDEVQTDRNKNEKESSTVEFGSGRMLAVLGLIAGVAIALLIPWMTLRYGDRLSPSQQLIIIIIAASIGGLVALTAAFFGTVMPSSVSNGPAKPMKPRESSAGPEMRQ